MLMPSAHTTGSLDPAGKLPKSSSIFIEFAQPIEYLYAWHHRGEKHGICVLTWLGPGQSELRALEDVPENRSADFSSQGFSGRVGQPRQSHLHAS